MSRGDWEIELIAAVIGMCIVAAFTVLFMLIL